MSEPSADVLMPISSSNLNETTVSPSSITLNASNGNLDNAVTITGVNDGIEDEDQAFSISLGTTVSTDLVYNGLNLVDINMINEAIPPAILLFSAGKYRGHFIGTTPQ